MAGATMDRVHDVTNVLTSRRGLMFQAVHSLRFWPRRRSPVAEVAPSEPGRVHHRRSCERAARPGSPGEDDDSTGHPDRQLFNCGRAGAVPRPSRVGGREDVPVARLLDAKSRSRRHLHLARRNGRAEPRRGRLQPRRRDEPLAQGRGAAIGARGCIRKTARAVLGWGQRACLAPGRQLMPRRRRRPRLDGQSRWRKRVQSCNGSKIAITCAN